MGYFIADCHRSAHVSVVLDTALLTLVRVASRNDAGWGVKNELIAVRILVVEVETHCIAALLLDADASELPELDA